NVIPFGPAVMFHTIAALLLLALWIFATFWLFTTGTWRQFVPTLDGLVEVVKFYGEQHPHKKVIFPLAWSTGILYMTYNFWEHLPDAGFYMNIIANLHLLAGYIVAAFIIAHLYLLTIGAGFRAHVKPMISGYEDMNLTPEQEAYLEENGPCLLKAE
ncbi:MAG: cytochrome B, partial [Marinosulfonomonas sp.]